MARVSIWWEMGRCSRDIPLTLRLGYNIYYAPVSRNAAGYIPY